MRPFCEAAEITCRGCSLPLERRITDFGADDSFEKASKKLQEHYGIIIPISTVRTVTFKHGIDIKESTTLQTEMPIKSEIDCMIAEMDGSLIPIVDTADKTENTEPIDLRKTRKVRWQEAKLALAHPEGSSTLFFGSTLGKPDEAGDQILHCAIRAGAGSTTNIHCVGDGAPWIPNQITRAFKDNGRYLVDFYHLCDYVADASKSCGPDNPLGWLERQKKNLKESRSADVLQVLKPHLESVSTPDEKAPVRRCHRYIDNRPGQFDYKTAIDANLPIGSGEIESAHRYVIQDRLKIPGAWWKVNNAAKMLALKTLRANNEWEDYWKSRHGKPLQAA